jgi:hypothetical protein
VDVSSTYRTIAASLIGNLDADSLTSIYGFRVVDFGLLADIADRPQSSSSSVPAWQFVVPILLFLLIVIVVVMFIKQRRFVGSFVALILSLQQAYGED